jgi:hypothetical protein
MSVTVGPRSSPHAEPDTGAYWSSNARVSTGSSIAST